MIGNRSGPRQGALNGYDGNCKLRAANRVAASAHLSLGRLYNLTFSMKLLIFLYLFMYFFGR